MRKQLVAIKDTSNDFIHFTEKLSGANNEAWYPLGGLSLFARIESILKLAGIAENVVLIDKLRECGDCEDYLVTYNERVIDNLNITQDVCEKTQSSNFANATLSGFNDDIAVSIAIYPKKVKCTSQEDIALFFKESLAPLSNDGWSFDIQMGNKAF